MTTSSTTTASPGRLLGRRPNAWLVAHDHVDVSRGASPERRLTIDAEPQAVTFDRDAAAVLVIDMQNDFLCAGGWADAGGFAWQPMRAAIEPVRRVIAAAREAEIPVIWVCWGVRPDLADVAPPTLHTLNVTGSGTGIGDALPSGRGRALVRGGWPTQIVEDLEREPHELLVEKNRISGFHGSALDQLLRAQDIHTLFFTGIETDKCVESTLRDAYFLDYDCVLLLDATATTAPAYCIRATEYTTKTCWGFVSSTERFQAAVAAEVAR